MMTCNWRKLEADGFIDRCCAEPNGHTWGSTDCGVGHQGVRGCFTEDDPAAWDATCPDCGGHGEDREAPEDSESGEYPYCDTCDGLGVAEAVPLRLIGVGSVIAPASDTSKRLIITHVVDDGTWAATDVDRDHQWIIGRHVQDVYSVVRAVPPAHQEDRQ